MGDDIVILLTGGVSHIGTHVTAIPYEKDGSWHVTLQTWNMISHKDDILCKRAGFAHSSYRGMCLRSAF